MIAKPAIGSPCNGCGLCCRIEICSVGSFTLGLVDRYGDRAPGPCPILVSKDDGSQVCGLVERPRDYAPGRGSAHDLRRAAMIMIGAGAGCDEAADGEDAAALSDVQQRYLESVGAEAIRRAAATWFGAL